VNNVVVHQTTVVNVQNINVYRNTSVPNAVVVVNENRFGRGRITPARVTEVDVHSLKPIHTAPQVATTPASFVPTARRGIRPPEENLRQSVVSTRPPQRGAESASGGDRKAEPTGLSAPAPRVVTAPPRGEPGSAMPRPPFGQGTIERPTAERTQPPAPPRRDGARRADRAPDSAQTGPRQAPPPPQVTSPAPSGSSSPTDHPLPPAPSQKPESPRAPGRDTEPPPSAARQAVPQAPREPQGTSAPPVSAAPSGRRGGPPQAGRPEAAGPSARPLPGEPANQLSPGRAASKPPEPKQRHTPPAQDQQKGGPEKGQGERKGG